MNEHTYPDRYQPGVNWAVDAAWEILDCIKPGVLNNDTRAYLAGMIAGRLMRERAEACKPVIWTVPDGPYAR